jgi:hypothetical protein
VSHISGTTLERLSPVIAPIIMRPRAGASTLVVNQNNATLRRDGIQKRMSDLSSLHIDELPPLEAVQDEETKALLQAEYDRRKDALIPGQKTFNLLIEHFLEMFMNESNRMRFTTKAGDARDVLSAGTLEVIIHKLYDKNYVDMLDPEFPQIVLLTRDYFLEKDLDLISILRETYLKHQGSQILWQETIRMRVLNVLKLYTDNYLPDLNIVDKEFADLWKKFTDEMSGELNMYNRSTVEVLSKVKFLTKGSLEADAALEKEAKSVAKIPEKTKKELVRFFNFFFSLFLFLIILSGADRQDGSEGSGRVSDHLFRRFVSKRDAVGADASKLAEKRMLAQLLGSGGQLCFVSGLDCASDIECVRQGTSASGDAAGGRCLSFARIEQFSRLFCSLCGSG